ncbi:MAG: hypothetical protein M1840_006082 [Geoglossum simile]|nr:MAG: hypothetical protein M1840_006082 [Geoglossum simile]
MALSGDGPGQFVPSQEDEDPFVSLLGLEEKFYQEGHAEGESDGTRSGLIEGRVFGVEKGFEKYLAMGRLRGRAVVWAGRLQKYQTPESGKPLLSQAPVANGGESNQPGSKVAPPQRPRLPSLPVNPRLEKHIKTLCALTEPASLSIENTEDSVSEFDDRLKRALAKGKVIERVIGESDLNPDGDNMLSEEQRWDREKRGGGYGNIEDVDILRVRQ